MVRFEGEGFVSEPPVKFFFGRKVSVKYEDIERVELSENPEVFFYLKNGKVKKVPDPGIVMYYTAFGEMLRKYKIPYIAKSKDPEPEGVSIETVREKVALCRETALACANRIIREKLGPEYEFEAKIVERIVGTTIEFRLFKDGKLYEEANWDESIDGEPLAEEMDAAFLSEWEPVYDRGKYQIADEALDPAACEDYVENVFLEDFLKYYRR